MPQYGEATYWDQRYSREPSQFDWYHGYSGLRYLLHEYLPPEEDILQIGVGTSRIQEDMVSNGYKRVVNVDISPVAIELMRQVHKGIPQLEYEVVDVKHMEQYKNDSFGGVLDKGTLDAVLCGTMSYEHSATLLKEVYRVLKPGGHYMLVTYGDPPSRLRYLIKEGLHWQVSLHLVTKASEDASQVEGGQVLIKGPYDVQDNALMESLVHLQNVHYVYTCKKPKVADSDDDE